MKILLALLIWSACVTGSLAQDISALATSVIKLNRYFFPLCGRTNFSMIVWAEILSTSGERKLTIPFLFFNADGVTRQDLLLSEMANLPAENRRRMKLLGTDLVTVVMRPEDSKACLSLNRLHAYCEMALSADLLEDPMGKNVRYQETAIGTEEIEGEEYAKAQFIEVGHSREVAVIWRSKTSGFPLKLEMRSPDLGGINLRFFKVDLRKPPQAYFIVPTNYVKLPDSKAFIPYAVELMKRRNAQSPERPAPGEAGQ